MNSPIKTHQPKEIRLTVTGAAGQIGYAFLFRLVHEELFGPNVRLHLNLLELEPAIPALKGVCMELWDTAPEQLSRIKITSNVYEAFEGAQWALLIGSVPRKAGMERSDLLRINGKVFVEQGKAINKGAAKDVKVIVVGNPCNTNAFIAKSQCPDKDERSFYAMTMLDEARARYQLALRVGVHVKAIKHMAIWGNHSATQYPDFMHATCEGRRIPEVITDRAWLEGDFLRIVQQRGAEIIKARGSSSAASAASALIDTIKQLLISTHKADFYSLGLSSRGEYGIPEGLIFSYPVRTIYNGEAPITSVVEGLTHSDFSHKQIAVTTQELLKERDMVRDLIV